MAEQSICGMGLRHDGAMTTPTEPAGSSPPPGPTTADEPDLWVDHGRAALAVSTYGSGRPILALHAGVCDRRSWRWCAPAWADAGFRTIAYDRRGFGGTRYEPEAYDALADARAITEATQARPAVVVGNSMGGALAVDLALAHPDEVLALVLIGSLPSGAPGEAWVQSDAETALEAEFVAAAESDDLERVNRLEVHYWLDGPGQPDRRVTGAPRDLMLEMNRRALAAPSAGEDAARPEAWSRLGDIDVPTLLVLGEHDETGLRPLTEMMAARLPRARLTVMDDTAHCPMLDRPDALASTVLEFLATAGPF